MKTDVAIIGGGPGGSATAMFLAQTGLRVTLIEKAQSPRYHIGESLTGECGNCLRTLGLEAEMTTRRHPVKYGVTVYGPRGQNAFFVPVKGWRRESGLFDTHTWSVRRSDFDHMLFAAAAARGVGVMQAEAVAPLLNGDVVRGVRVRTNGGTVEDIASEVLVDASGPATFFSNAGVIGEKVRGSYDRQVAIFSQVLGGIRDPGAAGGNTLIFYRQKHHWAWFIPLDDQVTSVGVVVPADYYRSKNESKHQFLLRELDQLNPELTRRLPQIEFVEEVRGISNYSYRISNFTGKGFLCVGDSHRFIDPVFSFGVFFAMKEAEYAAASIASFFADSKREQPNPLMIRAETREWLMNVQEVLTDYIREIVAKTGQPLPTLDQPLLDSAGGAIDSMNMWPLIVFVEERFGIKVEDTDLMQENFRTLRALIKFIESKHSELHS